jgi:hypothetical protein
MAFGAACELDEDLIVRCVHQVGLRIVAQWLDTLAVDTFLETDEPPGPQQRLAYV